MKEWPKDGSTVNFRELAEPVYDAVKVAYKLQRINKGQAILWEGFNIGKHELVGNFPPEDRLSAENLRYDDEDQGRDALRVIIGIAIQLGVEQGRRIAKQEIKHDLEVLAINILCPLERFLEKYS